MGKIVAVVVTYNRSNLLVECVEALMNSGTTTDILVIDNASTDNTHEVIAPYIDNKKIFYFNTGKNLGGAGGFHYGIRKAYEMGYDYFWIMDDDTIVHRDSLEEILKVADQNEKEFGFISSLALWTDGSECRMNFHYIADDWNMVKKTLNDGVLKISGATFVSFFIRRAVVEDVGLPIKEYFIWGDDTEFSQRISKKYHCYLAFRSQVTHKMSSNDLTSEYYTFTDKARIERMFYSIRNDCCTYKRMGIKRFRRFVMQYLRMLKKVMFYKDVPYRGKKVRVLMKGMVQGLLFHPKIELVN